jgi:hypothetical protein
MWTFSSFKKILFQEKQCQSIHILTGFALIFYLFFTEKIESFLYQNGVWKYFQIRKTEMEKEKNNRKIEKASGRHSGPAPESPHGPSSHFPNRYVLYSPYRW